MCAVYWTVYSDLRGGDVCKGAKFIFHYFYKLFSSLFSNCKCMQIRENFESGFKGGDAAPNCVFIRRCTVIQGGNVCTQFTLCNPLDPTPPTPLPSVPYRFHPNSSPKVGSSHQPCIALQLSCMHADSTSALLLVSSEFFYIALHLCCICIALSAPSDRFLSDSSPTLLIRWVLLISEG